MSTAALSLLEQAGIPVEYDELVEALYYGQAEAGHGDPGAVEQLAANMTDPQQLLTQLQQFVAGRDAASC